MSGPQSGDSPADADPGPHPIHEAIRREAERVRSRPTGYTMARDYPALNALLNAARAAVDANLPGAYEFKGRRYYLRCRLAVELEVFDEPAAARPLVVGASISGGSFGHVPGH